jgi:hypothetical protein
MEQLHVEKVERHLAAALSERRRGAIPYTILTVSATLAFLASVAQRSLTDGHPADLIGVASRMFEGSCMAPVCTSDFVAT